MTAPDDEPPPEARRKPRPRVALRGKLVHGFRREVAEVIVRNLTDGGAKVRLTSIVETVVGDSLTLRLPSGDRDCTVAWRTGDEIGLRFD